jgi:cardiolipin synthase
VLLLFIFGKPFEVKPLFISKVNTLLQIMMVVWILGVRAFAISVPLISELLIYAVMLTTILSGVFYVLVWLRCLAETESLS